MTPPAAPPRRLRIAGGAAPPAGMDHPGEARRGPGRAGWLVLAAILGGWGPGAAPAGLGAENGLGERPYLGWTSWSLSATTRPGYGKGWLSAAHVKEQADALATRLGRHGYTYVNVDAGWRGGWDEHGRPVADAARFPLGMRDLADHVHRLGLKFGIYYVPGIDDDLLQLNPPILGTPHRVRDIVLTPRRQANHWGGHAIDFERPGAAPTSSRSPTASPSGASTSSSSTASPPAATSATRPSTPARASPPGAAP